MTEISINSIGPFLSLLLFAIIIVVLLLSTLQLLTVFAYLYSLLVNACSFHPLRCCSLSSCQMSLYFFMLTFYANDLTSLPCVSSFNSSRPSGPIFLPAYVFLSVDVFLPFRALLAKRVQIEASQGGSVSEFRPARSVERSGR